MQQKITKLYHIYLCLYVLYHICKSWINQFLDCKCNVVIEGRINKQASADFISLRAEDFRQSEMSVHATKVIIYFST